MLINAVPEDVPIGANARAQLLRLFDLPPEAVRQLWRQKFDPTHRNVYRGWFPLQKGFPTAKEGIDIGADVAYGAGVVDSSDPLREGTPLPAEEALPGWRVAVATYYRGMSRPYTNPLGVRLGPCTYCGFCEWFACANYSKASPQTTILPVLVRKPNFRARDNSEVTRINLDPTGTRATGVTFVDTEGKEWEQPADLVILSAYTIFNVQLLLHSGIGTPYDPRSNQGVIGRNLTHQTISDVIGFFDKAKYRFNPFIASGSIGMRKYATPTRVPSSTTSCMAVSSGVRLRILATAASVLPV